LHLNVLNLIFHYLFNSLRRIMSTEGTKNFLKNSKILEIGQIINDLILILELSKPLIQCNSLFYDSCEFIVVLLTFFPHFIPLDF